MAVEDSRNLEESRVKIKIRSVAILAVLATVQSLLSPVSAFATPDVTTWTSHSVPESNGWNDIAYGNGVYVAVAGDGDGQRVMTSSNGVTWTLRTPFAEALEWKSVTFGAGLFVAVSFNNDVMTSSDGITWTRRTPASRIGWMSVVYGAGLFVAVATTGAGNRVMTSPDGITWTGRTPSVSASWSAITYGNGIFVAVSWTDNVMTSSDGVTWTARTSAGLRADWNDITFGNGLFVAVGSSGEVMRSTNGITWIDSAVPGNILVSITFGDGYFVALDQDVTALDRFVTVGGVTTLVATDIIVANRPQIITSTDGRVWRDQNPSNDSVWTSLIYGDGRFVAVSGFGYGDRVMRSGVVVVTPPAPDPAAVEAARLAAEKAAIAEAARLRQIEIDNFRKILFAKLVHGERPTLLEYNNAIFYQITSRTIENVTDQVLQLDPSKRSDASTINSIADGAAFYDAFFNPLFRPTVSTYARYGYFGVTERTLASVNAKVLMLPVTKRKDGVGIQEIATVENFVDQISNPATQQSVSASRLVQMGLLAADSPYKSSVINALHNRDASTLNSMEKIADAIRAELAVIQARKDRTAAIKAKIAARHR